MTDYSELVSRVRLAANTSDDAVAVLLPDVVAALELADGAQAAITAESVLRNFVMDFAGKSCDNPLICNCSEARAIQFVQKYDAEAAQVALERSAGVAS